MFKDPVSLYGSSIYYSTDKKENCPFRQKEK